MIYYDIYNYHKNNYGVTIYPSEELCPKCHGSGENKDQLYIYRPCILCKGEGKIDWIQKAMGKAEQAPP